MLNTIEYPLITLEAKFALRENKPRLRRVGPEIWKPKVERRRRHRARLGAGSVGGLRVAHNVVTTVASVLRTLLH
jgi:hypothetical protein